MKKAVIIAGVQTGYVAGTVAGGYRITPFLATTPATVYPTEMAATRALIDTLDHPDAVKVAQAEKRLDSLAASPLLGGLLQDLQAAIDHARTVLAAQGGAV